MKELYGKLNKQIKYITQLNNQSKNIIENGEYTYDPGYTGLERVTVNVPKFNSLTAESLLEIINAFEDRSLTTPLTITMPEELYQKLTAEMLNLIAIKNILLSTY